MAEDDRGATPIIRSFTYDVAQAAAAEGRIALDQLVIQQLPDLLRAAAEGLQGANLTILNGADGLSGVVASLAGQGLAVLDSVRRSLDHDAIDTDENPSSGTGLSQAR